MGSVRVGRYELSEDLASSAFDDYVSASGNDARGFPAYDGLVTSDDPARLVDGDLLAPVLLGCPISPVAFASLKSREEELGEALAKIPPDLDLVESDSSQLELLAPLFAPLGRGDGLRGVQGTMLSMVLHRKRPRFVPLYDTFIWRCYSGGEGAPIEQDPARSWSRYIVLLAAAMRSDLRDAADFWHSLETPAGLPPVTPLRALDVVAGSVGRGRSGPSD